MSKAYKMDLLCQIRNLTTLDKGLTIGCQELTGGMFSGIGLHLTGDLFEHSVQHYS